MALRAVAQTQTPTPTADQMAIFQNLPPEQQQAILEGLATEGGDGTRRDPDLAMPGTTEPKTERRSARGRGSDCDRALRQWIRSNSSASRASSAATRC